MSLTIVSKGFGNLSRIGTVKRRNQIKPPVNTNSRKVDVAVAQDRKNATVNLQITLPATRTQRGSRRVAALNLNGSQAREVYETLRAFYEFHQNR